MDILHLAAPCRNVPVTFTLDIMRAIALALAVLIGSSAYAQEFKPFPRAKITQEQWSDYFNSVSSKHGDRRREFQSENLVVFDDPESGMQWAFTTSAHAAHPAWITRVPTQDGQGVFIRMIGYYAGDERPFAELFRAYQALNERMREDMQKRPKEAR